MPSLLEVDKLDPRGTTLEIGSSGDTITFPSGVTLNVSLGTLTLPNPIPANSGENLTSLNASNLTSGTVPPARLGSGTADATTFLRGDNSWSDPGGGGGGITDFDVYRISTGYSASGILTSWERATVANTTNRAPALLGGVMGYSTLGEFTFPSTGLWWIHLGCGFETVTANRYVQLSIKVTHNNDSYAIASAGWTHVPAPFSGNSPNTASVYCSAFLDIASTTSNKCYMNIAPASGSMSMFGGDDGSCFVHFVKVAAT